MVWKLARRTKLYRYLWRIADAWPYLRWREILNPLNLLACWRVCDYTKLNLAGLVNVRLLARMVDRAGVKGAFVECGVWRGGCAALMGQLAEASGRRLWLFDSFEGMPEASHRDIGERAAKLALGRMEGRLVPVGSNVASLQEVTDLLHGETGLRADTVTIRKGWFQHTVEPASHDIGPIAILRLDGDWYESTRVCLEGLYENVAEGGFIIIDDYGCVPGCRAAVDEFLAFHHPDTQLTAVDYTVVYFQKPFLSHGHAGK